MLDNIWSDNKYINLAVNILIFLLSINFMHYGQLLLPLICFLLFIDNRMRFKVNDPVVFVALCLFGVSFYAFSHQLGFYSAMGFTLPMAYYVGSNVRYSNEENTKKIIYLLAFGMGLHVILSGIMEMILHGPHGFFMSSTHYDFWTRQKMSSTAIAIDEDLLIGILYYVLLKENNRKCKVLLITELVLGMFYLIVIGRRTSLMMMITSFMAMFAYEAIVTKNISIKLVRILICIAIIFISLALVITVFYRFDIFSSRLFFDQFKIITVFQQGVLDTDRLKLFIGAIKLMPYHLFGGQEISSILGMPVHELWLDIYDYAGIIPYLLMIIYSLMFVRTILRLFRNEGISNNTKILLFGVDICIMIQMFLEPVMTGASLFLIISIIIDGITERMLIEEK